MKILYIGDIMGRPGREVVKSVLPKLKAERQIDVVIAQAENVTHGKGMTPEHMRELQAAGVDVFSGGNHSAEREASHGILNDPLEPVIRPINMPDSVPGRGSFVFDGPAGKVLVASILGETFPRSYYDAHPLEAVQRLIKSINPEEYSAIVINLHADYSSDKRIFGYFLDGQITLAVGDHWHVPTADAMILPGGTAHITDVGMCGTVHTSLGLSMQGAIERWRDGERIKHDIVDEPPYQFNAVLVETGAGILAKSIESINLIIDKRLN